ncbi:hypothetical protein, partial [Ureibacillus terrenus]|uniref:hypothetical protein n=1 Tax=Ureibacillus terrenus TaxID=118246 RepID=UPI002E1F6F26|nr:hypothetical protein [Ureibacillus terrenus]
TAEKGVEYCNRLYELERKFKKLSPSKRRKARKKYSKPIVVNYHFISAQKRLFFAHSFGISLSPFPKECAKFFVNYFGMGHG